MAAASFDGEVPRHGGGAGSSGALGVRAASRKIGKQQERKPVIIYMVSPKVIHVEADEFMPLVQRLTGPDSGGRGDMKSRPSTSGGGTSSSPTARPREQEGARNKGAGDRTDAAPPVRVKARALNRPAGAAVSVSVTATRMANAPSAGPSPSGLMFHDLVSPGWLHHVGDHFLSPGAAAAGLGSPSARFLDIFGPLSSQQQ